MVGEHFLEKDEEIWVNDFNEKSAQEFRAKIMAQAKNPHKPIVVYIDSYGGEVDALAKMIGTMDEVSNTIITVCLGKAMSCGAILLSHGDIRFCDHNSRIMLHEIISSAEGNVHDVNTSAKETKRINTYFLDLLARNCGYEEGYKKFRQIIHDYGSRELYLTPSMAKKFKIIDFIGLPKITEQVSYKIEVIDGKKRVAIRRNNKFK